MAARFRPTYTSARRPVIAGPYRNAVERRILNQPARKG